MEITFDNCNSIICESKIICQKLKLILICVVFVVRSHVCLDLVIPELNREVRQRQ